MSGVTLVLAGSFAQYQHWLREHGLAPAEYRYISDYHVVLGHHQPHYIKVGTWWEREDADRILEQLRVRQAVEVHTP